MTAPAGVRVFFIVQPHCPVRVAQYPGANRAEDTSRSFGIMVEDVRKVAMLFVIIEIQRLVGVLHGLGELARPTVASCRQCVSRDQQVGIASRLRHVQHLLAHGKDSATRPCVRTLTNNPQRMGASAS